MNIRKELEKVGSIYEGHFIGVSGKHLSGYLNIDPFLPHSKLVSQSIEELVKPFVNDGVQTVAVPAVGAIPLSPLAARYLEKITKWEVLGVWADKDGHGGFAFERSGFLEAIKGRRVLLLEDMINQMHSVSKMIKLVRESGGEVIGVAAIAVNRGVSAEALGVPKFNRLADVFYDVWSEEECMKNGPCSRHEPIVVDVGHPDEFQKNNPKYAGGYIGILKKN